MKTNIVINISPPYRSKLWVSIYAPKYCHPIRLQDSLKCNILRKKWMIKLVFCLLINIKVFYKLILSFWMILSHAQSTQNKFAYLCNISIKVLGMKLIFCLQINTKIFYKMIVSLWVCVARHAQSAENSKFTISLQYLKENVNDEDDVLPADKCRRFLQSDAVILSVSGQTCPNFPELTSLLFLCNMLKQKWVMQLIFCMEISMKACYKLILRFFDGGGQAFPKFPK